MQVMQDLDEGETQIVGLELHQDTLEGAEIQSTRPGWGWDVTWIELRCKSWDVDRVIWD